MSTGESYKNQSCPQ